MKILCVKTDSLPARPFTGAGLGRGAAPLETGNEFLFHCYLFPVPPAGPSVVPPSSYRGHSRKGRHDTLAAVGLLCVLIYIKKKFLVVSFIILGIHY